MLPMEVGGVEIRLRGVVGTMAFARSLSAHYSHLSNSSISRSPLAFFIFIILLFYYFKYNMPRWSWTPPAHCILTVPFIELFIATYSLFFTFHFTSFIFLFHFFHILFSLFCGTFCVAITLWHRRGEWHATVTPGWCTGMCVGVEPPTLGLWDQHTNHYNVLSQTKHACIHSRGNKLCRRKAKKVWSTKVVVGRNLKKKNMEYKIASR